MQSATNEVIVVLIAGTILMLLLATFVASFFFIYQRKRHEHQQELIRTHESYQREILQAQIETQNHTLQHVAEELHDNIGQLLSVITLQLNVLDEDLTGTAHHSAVQQTSHLVAQALGDLRSLSKSLNGDSLARLGLYDSIALELERIGRTGRYQTQLLVSGTLHPLDSQVEIVLMRMVQESLSNALKHARAKTLTVTLDGQPDGLHIQVADDGRGFAVDEQSATANGSGLANLQRRAALLGGTCMWQSLPNKGTTVSIYLPFT